MTAETTSTDGSGTPGIVRPAVADWLRSHCGLSEPFGYELIAGGRSNYTYRVTTGGGRGPNVILRRPPTGDLLPSAHDMAREHRVITALHGSIVPVARPLGLCEDPAVTGAPFYVMEAVDGLVVRDTATAADLGPTVIDRAVSSLVEVMARIHSLDPSAVGLADLGRHDGYIDRQLRRWHRQSEQSRGRDLPMVDEVFARLSSAIPEQQRTAIVHGDYRLDNVMIAGPDSPAPGTVTAEPDSPAPGTVIAVFDWEICTLGDPLADLGLLLTYWSQAEDEFVALPNSPSTLDGFPTRDVVVDQYASASDLSLDDLPFYVAFGHWKVACILDGVAARYRAGMMEGDTDGFEDIVDRAAERARDLLDGSPI